MTVIDPDGTTHNLTNRVTSSKFIGVMQSGEQRDISFQADHARNVSAAVTIVIQWKGGSAAAFEKTLDMPGHSFGTFEF